MNYFPDDQIKIIMERKDGTVMEITGLIKKMQINSIMNTEMIDDGSGWEKHIPTTRGIEVTFTLVGNGPPVWTTNKKMAAVIEKAIQAEEWKCDHCGRPNKREEEVCLSCGAVRSFIWG